MAAALTTYTKNKVLDWVTGTSEAGFDLYCGLAISGTEITGHGYARVSADGKFAAAALGHADNDEALLFPVCTGTPYTPNQAAWFDGASGPQVTEWETVTMAAVEVGSRPRLPIGAGDLTLSNPA